VDAALATITACGLSFCSSAAADAAMALAADAAATIAACGSSFCSSAAADAATADAAVSTADANSIRLKRDGVQHSVSFHIPKGHTVMHALRAGGLRPLRYTFPHLIPFGFLVSHLRLFLLLLFLQLFFQHTCLVNLVNGVTVNNQLSVHTRFLS
jgi:hypothetical protein